MNVARNLMLTMLVAGLLLACRPITPEGNTSSRPAAVDPAPVVVPDDPVAPDDPILTLTIVPTQTDRQDINEPVEPVEPRDPVDLPPFDLDDDDAQESDLAVDWADSERIERGAQVYRENYCGVCHRLAVVGATGAFGPGHDEMGRVAWERIASPRYDGHATDAAGYIYESIVDPYIYLVETYEVTAHRMPPYGHLDDDALEALVAFLLAQE